MNFFVPDHKNRARLIRVRDEESSLSERKGVKYEMRSMRAWEKVWMREGHSERVSEKV